MTLILSALSPMLYKANFIHVDRGPDRLQPPRFPNDVFRIRLQEMNRLLIAQLIALMD